jgi:predicted dehydrogenase
MAQKEKSNTTDGLTRRQFIQGTGKAAAAITIGQSISTRVLGANERLGVGFIGCGGRGNGHLKVVHWLKAYAKEPVELVAACDTYRPRMQKTVDAYGVKGYTDHRELLADPNVDAVCIATCDHQHGQQAIDAVRAGKDVYCEKPVTHWRQFELTKKLATEVKKSGCVFQLGTQGMSDSAWRQMKQLVQQGLIGQPIHAECGFFRVGDWGERGMPIDDPNAKPGPDLNWDAFLGDAPKRPFDISRYFRWRMYEDYSGGPSTDLFPHSLTPVLSILGVTMPSKVVATGGKFRYQEREVPDTFNMLIDYPEKITVAVLGTQGNNNQATGKRGSGKRIPVIRGWQGSLTIQDKKIVFIPTLGSEKKPQTFDIEHEEDFTEYWRQFITFCRTRNRQTLSPADLAYHVQTVLQMGMLGLQEEKVAKFDSINEKIIL